MTADKINAPSATPHHPTQGNTMHALSESMIKALNFYANDGRIGRSPVSGTVVALLTRGLISYGDHVLTDAGREAHRALFAWIDDPDYGGAHYVRRPVAPKGKTVTPYLITDLRARELATAEREAHEEDLTRTRLESIAALDYVTVEFTNDAFLGSGALDYSWYQKIVIEETDTSWTLTFADLDDEPVKDEQSIYTVTHKSVLKAVAKIASGQKRAGDRCRDDCQLMVDGSMDDVDFDADTADQVLQIAAFGKIIYG